MRELKTTIQFQGKLLHISELPSENRKPIEQNTLTFDEYVVF